jgi:NAD(P)-dependent dehydrogenase (short-subunit alcohol dehydrogenase family)
MMETQPGQTGTILITGGTSGLGLELVKLFHEKGFDIICTGRQTKNLPGYQKRFRFISIDFIDLANTALIIREICKTSLPDFVICNAGILSPPEFIRTGDGFELTFQVNFLANLLVNEVIIRNVPDDHHLKIVSVTSPVYKMAKAFPDLNGDNRNYRPLKSYSDSKLYLALMGNHLTAKYPGKNLSCFSVDPGVFSSSIYRTQGKLFRLLYRIAAPFMRDPSSVAATIYEMMVHQEFSYGAIFNTRRRREHLPEYDQALAGSFWAKCNEIIELYYKP